MTDKKNFYITTPIYYVNDAPHIGHAYTTLACDTMARYKRLMGYDVKFATGTDEHGQKVEKAAVAAGMDPQAFVDKVSQTFRHLAEEMQLTEHTFIRTTEQRHKEAAQQLWKELIDRGEIYLGSYAGWYSVRDEAFYAESELINGKAPTGAPVEWVEEPSYFFKLSAWGDKLLEYYEQNPDFIQPESRRNEVISFVKSGLRDLSVSRASFKWGVPVPNDQDHVMYVWLDALTNYLTVLGYPNTNSEDYKKFWPEAVHVVGKDILRFHAVYWPAFLMAAGLNPPKKIFAHGWWTNEGEKISKSLGNTIDPIELMDTFGLDAVRYFLLREVSFGQDGDFSRNALIARYNSDLANSYGNLVQRVLSFIYKQCNGRVPSVRGMNSSEFTLEDHSLLGEISNNFSLLCEKSDMNSFAFHKYIERIWRIIAKANQYVDEQKPWGLKVTDPKRMHTILYVLAETIRRIAILTQPILPIASGKILDQLAVSKENRTFADLNLVNALVSGTSLPEPQAVFPRWIEKA
ncbi:MAG: methionine--tRNA ligase [Gammaproteobacteria bacterium]|nr:methionine--tRNA ligase [Gammaproteobacteria bacterium]